MTVDEKRACIDPVHQQLSIMRHLVCFGEVGLSGEIRPVPNGLERLNEAAKHGFKKAIVPAANAPRKPLQGIGVVGVSKLSHALAVIDT